MRNTRVNMSGIHPNEGDKIWMENLSGKFIYTVGSKKNNKANDYIYNLINVENEITFFNLKSMFWGFQEDEDKEHDETFLEK